MPAPDYSDDRPMGEQVARLRERLHHMAQTIAELRASTSQLPGVLVRIEVIQAAQEQIGATVREFSTLSVKHTTTLETALTHVVELRSALQDLQRSNGDQGASARDALEAALGRADASVKAAIEEARANSVDPIAREQAKRNADDIRGLQSADRRLLWWLIGILIMIIAGGAGLWIGK